MKRCPECRRDYYDDSLLYCLDDGAALLEGPGASQEPHTVRLPNEVAIRASTASTPRPNAKPRSSPADELYFQGRFYSGRDNQADNQKAIELLEQAIQIDPDHALSYIELARAYGVRVFYFDSENKELLAKSYAALQRAFNIGSHPAEAHEAEGFLLWTPANGFPHDQAIAAYRASLDIDSNLVDAHLWLSAVYFHIGLLEEAEAEIQITLQLDPGRNLARLHRAMVHGYAGRYQEAIYVLKALPKDLNPPLVGSTTAWCLLNLGRLDAGSDLIESSRLKYPADIGGQFAALSAMVLAAKGDAPNAEAAVAEAIDRGSGFGHFHHTTHYIAAAYALLGRADDAVRYLHVTADSGFPCYPLFENDPSFEIIRSHPEFQEFMFEQKGIWQDRAAKYCTSKGDRVATALFRRDV